MIVNLTKQDSAGRERTWSGTIEHDARTGTATMILRWGLRDGAMQEKRQEYKTGKAGRTALEQAELELSTLARKKMRSGGYGEAAGAGAPMDEEHEAEAGAAGPVVALREGDDLDAPRPMLVQGDPEKTMARWGEDERRYWQPKLDGVRGILNVRTGVLTSRQRKRIDSPYLNELLAQDLPLLRAVLPAWVTYLDGELYAHGAGFSAISGAVRRVTSRPGKPSAEDLGVRLHVYDLIDAFGRRPWDERVQELMALRAAQRGLAGIVVVDTFLQGDRDETDYHAQFVAEGYEGAIVRRGSGLYEQGKRSSALVKVKAFDQEEFVVVGVKPERGARPPRVGAVTVALDGSNDVTFDARPKASHEELQAMWGEREDLVGQVATVKFFGRDPTSRIPRFPILLGFRHADDV